MGSVRSHYVIKNLQNLRDVLENLQILIIYLNCSPTYLINSLNNFLGIQFLIILQFKILSYASLKLKFNKLW